MSKRKKTKPYEDPATPQTKARLKQGTMSRLIENSRIGGEEVRAAQEIERVYFGLTCQLFARGATYGERLARSSGDWPEWLVLAYHERYKPWADTVKQPILPVTVDILIEGMTGREIDTRRSWGKGKAVNFLIDGLQLYVDMAGWGSYKHLTNRAKCA